MKVIYNQVTERTQVEVFAKSNDAFKNMFRFIVMICVFTCVTLKAQVYTTWTQSNILKFPINHSGQPTGIGRVTHFAFHPTDSKTMFATSASGGLWKTTTEGQYWYNLNTDFFPWTTKMSCILVDHVNPDILYIGTGDTDYQSSDGRGVWKSTNGGNTWSQLVNTISNSLINRMIMSKTNTSVLLAAVRDGIYKSTNAGATWTRTLTAGPMRDVVMKPVAGGSNTVYACSENGFWISNDFGNTWTQVTAGLTPVDAASAFRSLRIGVSAANANIVYVLAQTDGTRTFAGLFRSTNSGTSFTRMSEASDPPSPARQNILGYAEDGLEVGSQGGYNLCITVHPANADIVYIGSHLIWKSTDGGATWLRRSCWGCSDDTGLHTDIHYIMFSPYYASPYRLYVCQDGGMTRTFDNRDDYWEVCSDGIAATEYYSYANARLYKEMYMGGTQDNGINYYWNRETYTIQGGDWFTDFEFDAYDVNYMYPNWMYNRHIFDMQGDVDIQMEWATQDNFGNLLTGSTEYFAPNYFVAANTNYLFGYAKKVWLCKNLKAANPFWTEIPIANAGNEDYAHGAASPVNLDLAYVVRKDNRVYRCTNASSATPAFTALTFPAGASSSNAYIEPHKTNANVVWLALDERLYRSNNQGGTWTNISANLPGLTILKVMHDRYSANEGIYVATASGVYYTDNTMANFILFSRGMPTIADITDMDMYNDGTFNSVIRVATYGRGIWEAELYKATPVSPRADFMAFSTQQTIGGQVAPQNPCDKYYLLSDKSQGQPTSWSWTITPSAGVNFVNETNSTSRNPMIQLTNPGLYEISLTVTNAQGSSTKKDSIEYFKPGINATCTPNVIEGAGFGLGIANVTFANINSRTDFTSAYNDYTCSQSTIVQQGSVYPLSVTTSTYNGGDNIVVWLDYNNNGSFTDAGELIYNGPNGALTHAGNVTISTAVSTVLNTPLRMRVAGYSNWEAKTTNPCISNTYNEIEDYAVMIIPITGLPVEVISFQATLENPAVKLSWNTVQEKDLSHFLIEKTTALGNTWEKLDEVKARGNSSVLETYFCYDAKPGNTGVYYRLTAIDVDGKQSYSDIIHLRMDRQHDYHAFPNPTTDYVNVFSDIDANINERKILVLRDVSGREIKRIEMQHTSASISLKELSAGTYVLEIYNEQKAWQAKVVKQ